MTTKVTISGMPRKYDEAELKSIQEGFHSMYRSTDQCCEMVYGELPYLFLTKVIEKHTQGYSLTGKYPISMDTMNYHCHMIKPLEMQQADLLAIDEEQKQKYIAELEEELARYRTLLTQQLLEAAELKEQKKVEDARKKRLAEIQAEVDNVFKPLTIPE